MNTSRSMSPVFLLWPVEASLVREEHSWSLVQAHNSTHVGHVENLQWNQIEKMLCHLNNNIPLQIYYVYKPHI